MTDERTQEDAPHWPDPALPMSSSHARVATVRDGAADLLVWARHEAGERYRIDRAAGAGGHSLVFEAFDLKLERPVAIKFLRGSAVQGAPAPSHDLDKALLDEARAMARLRHEGLCPVYEIETGPGTPFLVMEWIDGLTLDEAWASSSREQKLQLLKRVVAAVAALHASGIVHGDLKPSNVLVDRRGRPVVVDFGLATRAGGSRGRAFGTPGFAAPEQLDPAGRVTPASDVFALGAMLYLLLTGEQAIADTSLEACRARALAVDYRLPQERAPEVPAGLQRICLTAMEPEAARRYCDAGAMQIDLGRWSRGEEVVARPSVLQGRFFDQVDTTMAHVDRWRRQSLVTDREANGLLDLLSRVRRPDSYWLVDARRLTLSQVMLYLGGWIALTALTAGLWLAWESFEGAPWLRWAIPAVTAATLGAAGGWLLHRNEPRIALGFFVVVNLAVAVSAVQLLRETGWLAPATVIEEGVSQLRQSLASPESQLATLVHPWQDPTLGWAMGAWNAQLLVVALAWLAASLFLRRVTGAAALTPMAAIAGLVLWVSSFAAAGYFQIGSDRSMSQLGAWLMVGGIVTLPISLRRNRMEERLERDAGEGVSLPRDAWSVATLAVACVVVGLFLVAWNASSLLTLWLVDDFALPTRRAAAFMVASIPLVGLAVLLNRRRTPLRARLGMGIRLIAPSWVLLPLLVIERDSGDPWWMLWQVVFFACVLVVAAMSALANWKPFLASSLLYFVLGYILLVVRLAEEFEARVGSIARIVMIVALLTGLAVMAAAYLLPRWRAVMRWRGA